MNDGAGNRRESFSTLLLVMAPFFSVFPALGLVLLALSRSTLSLFIGENSDALGLLKACRNCCLLLCVLSVLALAITVSATAASIRALLACQNGRVLVGGALKLGIITLVLEAIILGLLVFKGDTFFTITNAQADIRQIEEGTLETETVWIYPGSAPVRLPGPFGVVRPSPLTKIYAIGSSPEDWNNYFFPVGLGFAPEDVFQASEGLEWNEANVPRYELTYTSRLRFVVSAALAEGPVAD